MFDPFLTSVSEPRAQIDISQRRTGEEFLYVLADTLRMPKIQKYQSTYFFSGSKPSGPPLRSQIQFLISFYVISKYSLK